MVVEGHRFWRGATIAPPQTTYFSATAGAPPRRAAGAMHTTTMHVYLKCGNTTLHPRTCLRRCDDVESQRITPLVASNTWRSARSPRRAPTTAADRSGHTRVARPRKRIRASCSRVPGQSFGRGHVQRSRANPHWPRSATPAHRPCADRDGVKPVVSLADRVCPSCTISHPGVPVTLLSSSGPESPNLCAPLRYPAGTWPR
jgi:hypothetical protein